MKKVIIFLFVITIIFLLKENSNNKVLIPDNSIRFRIIAASNDLKDQEQKQDIKQDIEPIIKDVIKYSSNIEESRKKIKESIPLISSKIDKYNLNYDINYGYNYFPKKEYNNVEYKSGEYESLVIKLGEGLGDNWWCVLFPPLCLLESNYEDQKDTNYTFFIKEIIDKYN